MDLQVLENRLLHSLPRATLIDWLAHGEIRQLQACEVLSSPGQSLGWVHFPLTAIFVWLNFLHNGATTAIAMVGHEGATELHNMLSGSNHLLVQCAGKSLRVPSALVRKSLRQLPATQALYNDFQRALAAQVSQTAVCNRHHSLEQQLVRVLLLTLDRSTSRTLRMTHEQMARMLGTRRESVSAAAKALQQSDIIAYARGRIVVHDRHALLQRACECYHQVSQAYSKLKPKLQVWTHPRPSHT